MESGDSVTRRGASLLAEVEATRLASSQGAFWWLGQQGFVVKLGAATALLDPYLTPSPDRRVPPSMTPEQAAQVGVILGSHNHGDHIDRPAWRRIALRSEAARFVVPRLLKEKLSRELETPSDRFVGMDEGAPVTCGGLTITGIGAAHEFLDVDAGSGLHPYLGYVIEGNGLTLYHAGDCCVYEGLLTKLRRWPHFDVVFLPINGRDARRLASGCIGNMTYQEAADLAGALEPGLVVPSHYDMFAMNAEDPGLFADYMRVKYPHLTALLCEHWKGVRFGREGKSKGWNAPARERAEQKEAPLEP